MEVLSGKISIICLIQAGAVCLNQIHAIRFTSLFWDLNSLMRLIFLIASAAGLLDPLRFY